MNIKINDVKVDVKRIVVSLDEEAIKKVVEKAKEYEQVLV